MVASGVCLTYRIESFMQTGNFLQCVKQLDASAEIGKVSERQRQQPSLPIWTVFGRPSRSHMAVWVKELF